MSPETSRSAAVLVVEDEPTTRTLVAAILLDAGFTVSMAGNGAQALRKLEDSTPDLIISDVMMPDMDGHALVEALRANPLYRRIPVILLSALGSPEDIAKGLDLGADDYLAKPPNRSELLARVRSKLARPPVPAEELAWERQTGMLAAPALVQELEREVARYERGGRIGAFAYVELSEWKRISALHGVRAEEAVAQRMGQLLESVERPLELMGRGRGGRFLVLLPSTPLSVAREALGVIAERVVDTEFNVGGDRARLTPVIGFAMLERGSGVAEMQRRAEVALAHAREHLDLIPALWTEEMDERHREREAAAREGSGGPPPTRALLKRLALPLQLNLTLVFGVGLPFLAYYLLDHYWVDVTGFAYMVVVTMLLVSVILIWVEGILATRRVDPPEATAPPSPASAIIAAYLPNEAITVVETVESFLAQDYPGPLQVILAYNTPRDLPVEAHLRAMAERDPRLLPLRVEGSTSKAQNVNAALSDVTGEFVGIFDADHHPDPGSFLRAWRWLSNGWDVVQGHCVIRNGDASWVSRTVAVEFEHIYGVSHPGRARLHGFGIFGGSNGYWKTELLRGIRMRRFMLTEDIDSSMRAVKEGHRIRSDPYLVSRELAPVTFKALWNQRMRWAQGWFQVSLRWLLRGLASPNLSLRQKAGLTHLLFWREAFAWTAVQIIPIVAYWALFREQMDWFIPIFVFTTVFTLGSGPAGTYLAYRQADPAIKARRWWFYRYLLLYIFYSEAKTLVGRVAHMKELMGEEDWRVTPRRA